MQKMWRILIHIKWPVNSASYPGLEFSQCFMKSPTFDVLLHHKALHCFWQISLLVLPGPSKIWTPQWELYPHQQMPENNKPIFAIIAKRKTEGGGTWQFPCSKAMPFFRAAGQRFPPGLIRATRPCSVRSGRHYDIILLWIYTVGKILAIIVILVYSSIHTLSSPAKCDSSIHRGEVGKDTVLDLRPRSRYPGQPVAGCPWLCQSTFYFWVWNRDI